MRHNPHPAGTQEYYAHKAQAEGFKTIAEWAAYHRDNDPVCRLCGTTKGFAPGTGDCNCEGEPGVPLFVPNPRRKDAK